MKEVSAIEVNNLFKMYRLYPDNLSRLKEALHPLRKKYHREFFAVKDVCFSIKKRGNYRHRRKERVREIDAAEIDLPRYSTY